MATLIRSWMPMVLMVLSPYTGGVSAMETCGPQSGDCLRPFMENIRQWFESSMSASTI